MSTSLYFHVEIVLKSVAQIAQLVAKLKKAAVPVRGINNEN